jgi:signal transduction histidine kinase
MKAQFFASKPVCERPLTLTQQTREQQPFTKVPLHQLVHQLMTGLQPLAMKRGNVILNGIPQDLTIAAEENTLAYVLWNLINGAVNSTKNEVVHVVALVTGDRAMICVKDVGTYFYHAISREYRKIQNAAEQMGGTIHLDDEEGHGTNVYLSITNNRVTA